MTDTDHTDSEAPAPPPEPRGELASSHVRLALLVGSVVLLGMLTRMSVLIVVFAIVLMIFLHELGHYLTAKWTGMKVTEFFIGIGPRIWSFRRGETEYGVKAVPIAAYVRIIGMNNLDECPPEDEPRTYRQQSYPKRLLVVSAGSLMHFLQAFVMLVVLLGITGTPGGVALDIDRGQRTWIVGSVAGDSAAEVAGVEEGDRIVSFDGRPAPTFGDFGELVGPRAGDTVPVVVERDGQRLTLEATIGHRPDDRTSGFFGIGYSYPDKRLGPVSAVTHAGRELAVGTKQVTTTIGSFFTGRLGEFATQVRAGGNEAAGPVVGSGEPRGGGRPVAEGDENRLLSIYGAARIGAGLTDRGFQDLLLFMVSINLFIGVFNLVPLLPLDGGHVAIATYERIRSIGGRRHMADVSRLLPLAYAFVVFLLMLGVSSLYLDIVDPIGVG